MGKQDMDGWRGGGIKAGECYEGLKSSHGLIFFKSLPVIMAGLALSVGCHTCT